MGSQTVITSVRLRRTYNSLPQLRLPVQTLPASVLQAAARRGYNRAAWLAGTGAFLKAHKMRQHSIVNRRLFMSGGVRASWYRGSERLNYRLDCTR